MTLAQEKITELEKRNRELKSRLQELTIDNYKQKREKEKRLAKARK